MCGLTKASVSKGGLGYNYSFDYNEYLSFVIKDLCLYKFNSLIPVKGTESNEYMVVDYVNNLLDNLSLAKIMKGNNVKRLFPVNSDGLSIPCISYRYSKCIRSTVCNYQSASKCDYRNVECACGNYDNRYVDPNHGHVFTGDLSIVENQQLQSLLSKGLNFRETKKPDKNVACNSIKLSLNRYIDLLSNRLGKSADLFSPWKNEIVKEVKRKLDKMDMYKFNAVLKHKKNIDCLSKLQEDFIFVSVDKASNNVAVICKHYYAKVLHDEMIQSGHFTLVNENRTEVVNRCAESINNTSQIQVDEMFLNIV